MRVGKVWRSGQDCMLETAHCINIKENQFNIHACTVMYN